ncbi:MAG: hypothetical protein LBQ64_02430, partial [Bacteroidales bacterium]|nr:hypothetical protein [Bacteroidales bacterium]
MTVFRTMFNEKIVSLLVFFSDDNRTKIESNNQSKKNKMSKRIIHTEHAPKAIGPYSQAVEINGI